MSEQIHGFLSFHFTMPRPLKLRYLASIFACAFILGCGEQAGTGSQPPNTAAPVIVTQPASQTVPLGISATFSVAASGASPMSYQWERNGKPITGASSLSYTIEQVQETDNGASFSVIVSNASGTATSRPATLTIGARSPKLGDLRFQQVDAASTLHGYVGNQSTILLGRLGLTYTNQTGTPLSLGPEICSGDQHSPYACNWPVNSFYLPGGVSGLTTAYQSDYLSSFDVDLASVLKDPKTVITSLAMDPIYNAFAASYISTDDEGGFDATMHTVSEEDFASAAAQDALQGRVITAVAFNNGKLVYLSYGWQGNASTQYETMIETTDYDGIPSEATALAQSGYIITALGGNATDGFVLVGTRVAGDSAARPIVVALNGQQNTELWQQGYAIVALLEDQEGNLTWIGEK
ncbi:MAG TPA: immunoglobulin domain-containing protein [Alloacidobacterium sp.]|jgi:hypothetical protein|nr:immunoglobulin domain-containing protein [Alloacidobacterium sp.]